MNARQATVEERSEPRQDVLHRTRATGMDGKERAMTVVNVSPRGFMARCGDAYLAGDKITLVLPRVGKVAAEVRWALGGRIGCRLERMIGLADYHAVLQALLRG